jgi:branched-chain amino acid transport system substrate-binding protein
LKNFLLQVFFVLTSLFSLFYYMPQEEPKTIILGQTCPLTGQSAALGIDMMNGANTYFNYINRTGGINGKKIKLISYDDKYEPNIAQQNASILINQEKAIAIFGAIGTPTGQKSLSVAIENKVPFLTPFTGGKFLREPFNPLIINLRPSYEQEIKALIEYLVKEKKTLKIAVFYQNDSFGMEGLYATKKTISKQKTVELVSTGSFNRNTLSVQNAIYEISLKKPDAVILVAPYEPCAEFIKRARKSFELKNAYFCPISFTGTKNLEAELNEKMQNIIASQVLPDPYKSNREAIKIYRELYKKEFPAAEFSYVSLEGFLSAMLTIKAIQKAKSLNRKEIIKGFESLQNNDIGGFNISISSTDHQALDEVFIVDYNTK